ncbi:MAG: HAD family hydrolase [Clostridiales bacterium]|nr:HAD family hydrolase [Clostridiales bacterium]
MINTVLFDLDGTLLPLKQDKFLAAYLTELEKVFIRLGLPAQRAMEALWAGTKAMIKNDGTKKNAERFWAEFAAVTGLSGEALKAVEDACDGFYTHEFNAVKKAVAETDDPGLPRRMIDMLSSKGFILVLATNPLFPACAITTRLGWIGLLPQDFCLITDYSNSSFCKPNPGYYRGILAGLGKEARQCLMIGNNVKEDMCAGALGMETFLLTGFLENEDAADVSSFRQGSPAELELFLASLPSCR